MFVPLFQSHNSKTTRPSFTAFYVHVAYGRISVLLSQRCDTLRTSGFVDIAIFPHSGPVVRHVYS